MTDVLRLTDALPAVVDTSPALEAALRDLAAGEGPLGVDAERAGSYRYSQRAYLVQVYRRRAPVLLLDPVEIDDFSDVLTLVHPDVAQRNVQLTTQVEVESAMRVPSAVLRQVMLNMLLNGVSAAGEPGTVHAELRADADRLWFSVAHAGKAMTQDAMEAKLVAEGGDDPRGFGLWVCREIATQYGGGFDVDSHHGQGTRLVFWMPNREAHEELAAD